MEERIPTAQEIAQTISTARDSVWVIGNEILKEDITKQHVETVQRNVSHLELVMNNEYVIESGEDLSDLTGAIQDGNEFIELHKVEEPAPTEPPLEEMIVDGYNPDARDGDGDGMVQDTTDWERPIDS